MSDATRRGDGRRTIVLGLVADPGLPTEIAQGLVEGLPERLQREADGTVDWQVEVSSESLPIDASGDLTVLSEGTSMPDRGWDMMVGLTELPRRMGRRPVVLEVDARAHTAWLSVPALGGVRLRSQAGTAVVALANQMLGHGNGLDVDGAHGPGVTLPLANLPDVDGQPGEVQSGSMRGWAARMRLLFGMVRVNRPWQLVGSLDSVFAAAAATAAFGVFYASVWNMADTLSPARLVFINVVVISSMVWWLIFHNGLWERSTAHGGYSDQPRLYNATTVLTLLVGVACMYALLFIATFLASLTVISAEYLEASLGHPVDVKDYMQIAWLSSCMGVVAGALGSNFESEKAIRHAAYGRRQRERQT